MPPTSGKSTTRYRVEQLQRILQTNTNIDSLCAVFDAEVEDLRVFIRLNAPELLGAFEKVVVKGKPAPKIYRPSEAVRAKQASTAAAAARAEARYVPPVRLETNTQTLFDLIMGNAHFASEEERPFNKLSEDNQDLVRQQAELYRSYAR